MFGGLVSQIQVPKVKVSSVESEPFAPWGETLSIEFYPGLLQDYVSVPPTCFDVVFSFA